MTSNDMIELQVSTYCNLLSATGADVPEEFRQTCRESLRALVHLGQAELVLACRLDLEKLPTALKH